MENFKDSGIEVDFLSWMDVLNDVHVPKHLILRNYLKFVQSSLLIEIEQYLKKRRMLFHKRDIVSRECQIYEEVAPWNSFELFDLLQEM